MIHLSVQCPFPNFPVILSSRDLSKTKPCLMRRWLEIFLCRPVCELWSFYTWGLERKSIRRWWLPVAYPFQPKIFGNLVAHQPDRFHPETIYFDQYRSWPYQEIIVQEVNWECSSKHPIDGIFHRLRETRWMSQAVDKRWGVKNELGPSEWTPGFEMVRALSSTCQFLFG